MVGTSNQSDPEMAIDDILIGCQSWTSGMIEMARSRDIFQLMSEISSKNPHPMTDPWCCYINGNMDTPFMLAYIPAPWILWDMSEMSESQCSNLTMSHTTGYEIR